MSHKIPCPECGRMFDPRGIPPLRVCSVYCQGAAERERREQDQPAPTSAPPHADEYAPSPDPAAADLHPPAGGAAGSPSHDPTFHASEAKP